MHMLLAQLRSGCGSKPFWYHFGVGAPPILEPILVVGLVCSLGVWHFDPWPFPVLEAPKVVIVLKGAASQLQFLRGKSGDP